MKVSAYLQYNIICSRHNTTTMSLSPLPHADHALPKDGSRSLHPPRSSHPRPCSRPPPSHGCPAWSSSWPLSPPGALPSFSGGWGGVVVVVVIRVRAPHAVKETPGIVVVRMGKDDRPSPTTTRQVLPVWQHRRDAVHRDR